MLYTRLRKFLRRLAKKFPDVTQFFEMEFVFGTWTLEYAISHEVICVKNIEYCNVLFVSVFWWLLAQLEHWHCHANGCRYRILSCQPKCIQSGCGRVVCSRLTSRKRRVRFPSSRSSIFFIKWFIPVVQLLVQRLLFSSIINYIYIIQFSNKWYKY